MHVLLLLAALLSTGPDDGGEETEEVLVTAERPLSAASDQTIRNQDFESFPRRSASDLLRFVPGLHITQHTGGAKAHQIFLRGFDAEHGRDVAASLDGIPLNEVSHVHGEGYLDLHFLIPETLAGIRTFKGPYDARCGDHSSAGVIDFLPYTRRPGHGSVTLGAGTNPSGELLLQGHGRWLGMDTLAAIHVDHDEGFTDPGRMTAARALLHHVVPLGPRKELRLLYAGYGARSEASDILPLSWIDDGLDDRFGALDASNKVDADRHLAGLTFEGHRGPLRGRVQGYYNWKRTDIFSNYTNWYLDPEHGDQHRQYDRRHYGGLQGWLRHDARQRDLRFRTEVGLQTRLDAVIQRQDQTEARRLVNPVNRYAFTETALGLYLDERMTLAPWFRVVLGVRADAILYDGEGRQDHLGAFDISTNTTPLIEDGPIGLGTWAWAISPKASLVFTPLPGWNLFVNFGRGFVSAEARQIAFAPDETIPVVNAGEVGSRAALWGGRVNIALAAWAAHKESEAVFDSEVGASIPRGESLRVGADLEIRVTPRPWLVLATDLYWVRGRFLRSGEPIPNMAAWFMTNVLALRHPGGARLTLRGRFLGPRPLDLGYRSPPYYVLDVQLGWQHGPWEVSVAVENLLGMTWYDSVYAYPSRPVQGGEVVEGAHVTPGHPTLATMRLGVSF